MSAHRADKSSALWHSETIPCTSPGTEANTPCVKKMLDSSLSNEGIKKNTLCPYVISPQLSEISLILPYENWNVFFGQSIQLRSVAERWNAENQCLNKQGRTLKGGIAFLITCSLAILGTACLQVTVFKYIKFCLQKKKKENNGEEYSAGKHFSILLMVYNDYAINDDIINDRIKRTIGRNYTLKGST